MTWFDISWDPFRLAQVDNTNEGWLGNSFEVDLNSSYALNLKCLLTCKEQTSGNLADTENRSSSR